MNLKRPLTGLSIIFIAFFLAGFARIEDDPISRAAAMLNRWLTNHPQEKVYLQLDKPYYAAGDDLWFKAYVTVGSAHELSALSGVLNVELIDEKDSVKQSIKLPVVSGLTWGDFSLPDSLKEGNYRIRAYTNWMRNAGDEYFFDKTFTLVNSISNNVFTKTTYSFSAENGRETINAVINYTDINGNPYSPKQVTYEIRAGVKAIAKGKGLTDEKGNLNISFINPLPGQINHGSIITNIELPDKKTVTKSVLLKAISEKADLQFFPEGGNLVIGNNSKIAFKAVGADGLGTAVKGIVTDDQNNQVAAFNSTHLGMGVFSFVPENGRNYKAKAMFANGSENTIDLPKATNNGYSLVIDNADENTISVKIRPGAMATASSLETGVLGLVGQSGGVIYYAAKSKPGSKFITATIPKNKFPSGVVQFTLFSPSGEPLNERLIFVQNHDKLKMDLTSEKQTYSPREKVKIDLSAKNSDGKPVVGSFSIAVTDETKVPVDEDNENTILSNLLLTSDIKGYIEKPNYYFHDENEKTDADLDVLMLTQGYHRFEWKQILTGSFPPVLYPAQKTLEISGHLKTPGGKPVANGKVMLMSNTGAMFLIDTVTDNEGRFDFNNLVFKDSVKFIIQGRTAKDRKNLVIDLDNITSPNTGTDKTSPDFQVNIYDGRSAFLQNSKSFYTGLLKNGLINRSIQLKEVVVTAKKTSPAENSSNLNGPGNADQIIEAKNLVQGCARITDCLQGILFGVTFRNDTPYLNRSLNTPMLIVVDGSYVSGDVLNDLNANDIQSIEVLKNIMYTSIYGGRGSGGVLVVTTKRGGATPFYQRYAPGIITYMPKGYYKSRIFYSPKYDGTEVNSAIPDLRSTIYWKPNIVTGKDGTASLEFFNADNKGSCRIVVEGIDTDGNLGRKVYRYKVE